MCYFHTPALRGTRSAQAVRSFRAKSLPSADGRRFAVPTAVRQEGRHLRIRRLVQFILAGAVRYNVPRICATRVCRACADLICSTLSVNCEYFARLAVPLFRSGHMSAICARIRNKERQEFKEEGFNRTAREQWQSPASLPFCSRGRGHLPRSAARNSPLNLNEKPAARQERIADARTVQKEDAAQTE